MKKLMYNTSFLLLCFCSLCFAADFPFMVGTNVHGAKNIGIVKDLGVGNFIWIPKNNIPEDGNTPWDKEHDILADVDACVANKMSFVISQGRGLGLGVRPGGAEYGGDCSGLLHSAATITKISKRAGDLFMGLHAEELDADLIQSALRPSYRSRIPEIYNFTDRAGGRQRFEAALTELKTAYQGYKPGVKFWPNMCITHHHSGFRVGSDLVFAEFMEHLPTTELQLAYLRGGARQFGGNWGLWVSPWYAGQIPCEDKTLWKASYAQPGGGHSASSLRRCLYLAYVSGSRVFTGQNTEPIFAHKDPQKPEAGYKLAAWGSELKNFWDYAKNHTQPMKPIVNLALLVDKDNGWAPGRLWGDWVKHETVWGKLPTDRSDNMLSRYLDVLLPGYGRSEGCWAEKTIYPGYFASTPAGLFDIVSSDISAEKLSEYPNVVVMGDVSMTNELLNALRSYVKNGGSLYINVDQMRYQEAFVQDEELLGAKIGMSSFYVGWVGGHVPGRRIWYANKIVCKLPLQGVSQKEYSEPGFCPQDVQLSTAEVIADDGAGNPVLLRNHFGKGLLYLSTPEYMMEGYDNYDKTLSFFRQMILGLSGGPVTVTAPGSTLPQTDISWAASRQGDDSVVVTVVNHGKSERRVDVTWRGACKGGRIDVGGAKAEMDKQKDATRFTLDVKPEDVVLLRIMM